MFLIFARCSCLPFLELILERASFLRKYCILGIAKFPCFIKEICYVLLWSMELFFFQAWLEKSRVERGWNHKENGGYNSPGLAMYKKQKQLRTKLANIVTIDSIYEKRFISLDAVLEVVIIDVQLLSGKAILLLNTSILNMLWSVTKQDCFTVVLQEVLRVFTLLDFLSHVMVKLLRSFLSLKSGFYGCYFPLCEG